MDGILNINKPAGMSSFKVVARVKRITGERHAGHAGTLDPAASGVLPVCLGKATRIIEYLFAQTKTYLTEIEFGITTDSYDSEGSVIRTADASDISPSKIEEALTCFRGEIMQTPPMFSALKYAGQPLYKLARSGIEIERKSRPVRIFNLELIFWQPPVVTLEVVCSKGTYIRSLAHDLGERLGCGAYLKGLIRQRVGPFKVEESVTLEQLEDQFKNGMGNKLLYPLDYPLGDFPYITVSSEQKISLIHGLNISLDRASEPERSLYRAYSEEGLFIGMLAYLSESNLWKPHKIFVQE